MTDDDWLDFEDSGVQWCKTTKHYICRHCGHVGPAEAKAEEETQGDGVMTGTVWLATGELRCTECESDDLTQQDVTDDI